MNILKSKYFIITTIYIFYSIYYLITRTDFIYKIAESTIVFIVLLISFALYDKYKKNGI